MGGTCQDQGLSCDVYDFVTCLQHKENDPRVDKHFLKVGFRPKQRTKTKLGQNLCMSKEQHPEIQRLSCKQD